MRIILIILLVIFLSSNTKAQKKSLRKYLLSIPVVDGIAGFGGHVNSKTDKSIGAPNFDEDDQGLSVKERTFINITSINVNNDESYFDRVLNYFDKKCKGLIVIHNAEDIDKSINEDLFGIIFYTQKHFPLGDDINNIDRWYDKGLRIFQVHYGPQDPTNQTESERLGHSDFEKGGLTKLGKKAVEHLFNLNMIVDVSHCNEQTIIETSELAVKNGVPILGNHTAAISAKNKSKVMCKNLRLWSDKSILAVAKTGGVIGVMLYPGWLSCEPTYRKKYTKYANLEQVIAHIDYIVKLVGVEHVGIGSDGYLDGTTAYDTYGDGKIDSPERFYFIAKELRKRGYSLDDVSKILGGNFLRVYRQVLK